MKRSHPDKHSGDAHCDANGPGDNKGAPTKMRLGVLKDSGFKLTDAFWEPLPEEELRLWEGEDE